MKTCGDAAAWRYRGGLEALRVPDEERESRVTLIAAIIILAKCAVGSPASTSGWGESVPPTGFAPSATCNQGDAGGPAASFLADNAVVDLDSSGNRSCSNLRRDLPR